MSFQRARTEEQINKRRDEILAACNEIYEKEGYDAVTIKAIAERTSFSRPSIYTYFSTKEEIILGLLQQEYENWAKDLQDIFLRQKERTKANFCSLLTDSILRHEKMLKLQSSALTIIENSTSDEKLVAFKRTMFQSIHVVKDVTLYFFPDTTEDTVYSFIHMFFAYIHGLYPMAHPTPKQSEAMRMAGYTGQLSFRDFSYKGVFLLAEIL